MGARFVRTFGLVLTSPKMGRTAEEYQPGIRRINEGVYAIFYREIEEGIEVVRVLAGMQDLGTMFR